MSRRKNNRRLNRRESTRNWAVGTTPQMMVMRGFEVRTPSVVDVWYEAPLGSPPSGSTTMTSCVCFRCDELPDAINQQNFFITGSRSGLRGYYWEAYDGLLKFTVYDATPLAVQAIYVFTGGDVGKDFVFHGTYDGTTVRLYRQGVQVGLGTVGTGGYTSPLNTDRPNLGTNYGGDGLRQFGIIGEAHSDTTIIASPLTHFNNCVAAGNFVSFTGATHAWITNQSNFGGTTWNPAVGSVALTKTAGTLSVSFQTPNWAS